MSPQGINSQLWHLSTFFSLTASSVINFLVNCVCRTREVVDTSYESIHIANTQSHRKEKSYVCRWPLFFFLFRLCLNLVLIMVPINLCLWRPWHFFSLEKLHMQYTCYVYIYPLPFPFLLTSGLSRDGKLLHTWTLGESFTLLFLSFFSFCFHKVSTVLVLTPRSPTL